MDCSQCSGSRSLLRLVGAAAVGALWAGQDSARGNYDDLSVGELLLEFAGETLLNFVEAWEERDGHEDNDGFLCGDIDLRGMY